jgi:hypothetical protein
MRADVLSGQCGATPGKAAARADTETCVLVFGRRGAVVRGAGAMRRGRRGVGGSGGNEGGSRRKVPDPGLYEKFGIGEGMARG